MITASTGRVRRSCSIGRNRPASRVGSTEPAAEDSRVLVTREPISSSTSTQHNLTAITSDSLASTTTAQQELRDASDERSATISREGRRRSVTFSTVVYERLFSPDSPIVERTSAPTSRTLSRPDVISNLVDEMAREQADFFAQLTSREVIIIGMGWRSSLHRFAELVDEVSGETQRDIFAQLFELASRSGNISLEMITHLIEISNQDWSREQADFFAQLTSREVIIIGMDWRSSLHRFAELVDEVSGETQRDIFAQLFELASRSGNISLEMITHLIEISNQDWSDEQADFFAQLTSREVIIIGMDWRSSLHRFAELVDEVSGETQRDIFAQLFELASRSGNISLEMITHLIEISNQDWSDEQADFLSVIITYTSIEDTDITAELLDQISDLARSDISIEAINTIKYILRFCVEDIGLDQIKDLIETVNEYDCTAPRAEALRVYLKTLTEITIDIAKELFPRIFTHEWSKAQFMALIEGKGIDKAKNITSLSESELEESIDLLEVEATGDASEEVLD